jgi:hypothetical protein
MVFGAVLGIFLLGTETVGAGWEPTPRKKVKRMLELSEAGPSDVIYVALHRVNNRVRVVWGNFFHVDLSEATIVTLFLTQGTNQRLTSKLLSELKPGTRIVSYVWTFDGWTPKSRDMSNRLALYVVSERVTPGKG